MASTAVFSAGSRAVLAASARTIARPGGVERDARQQAFEVENAVKGTAHLFALHQVAVRLRRQLRSALRSAALSYKRTQDGGAQQALAHGRAAGIEGVKEGGAVVLAGKQRLDQFQIAHRYLVEFERR